MNEFFQRLRRRKLVQWAIAYAAAAFALLQGIDIVAQQFGWPEGVRRGITLALVVGFFVTLILAWYHGERGAQRVSGTELLIIGLVLAVGGGLLWRFAAASRAPDNTTMATPDESRMSGSTGAIPEKSIAVLPFVSLSKDEENAFFADGVQDQILTNLAKIAVLKVISRTSVMQYRNPASRNLREIAQQLGVVHVLEGSVQRAPGQVRVTAQLIDARKDAHEWAENYDRPIADVFAIQTEIARTIAEQLKVRISPGEEVAMSKPSTTDLVAQNLYIKAKELSAVGTNDPNSKRDLLEGIRLLNEATARDPNFFLAYCLLATLHDNMYWAGFDYTPGRLALEQTALDAAARLQPDAGELYLGRANYVYHARRDYDRARSELELARQKLPNNAEVLYLTALIDRRAPRRSALRADRRISCTEMNVGGFFARLKLVPDAAKFAPTARC
jgi:TolB-like protein